MKLTIESQLLRFFIDTSPNFKRQVHTKDRQVTASDKYANGATDNALTESRTMERKVRMKRIRNCVRKLVAKACDSLPESKLSCAVCYITNQTVASFS